MSNTAYEIFCQLDGIHKVVLTFAGNNGYVGMCGHCEKLFYYCAIFGKITVFSPDHKEIDMQFKDMKVISGND